MKKLIFFLCLNIFLLFFGCTSEKKKSSNINEVLIFADLDYRIKKSEYIKLWINDKMVFSNYYYPMDSLDYWPMYLASIDKQVNNAKIRIQILNLDTAFYHSKKQNVDTTFCYNLKDVKIIGIGYLKAYHGFCIYNNNEEPWLHSI